jgi:hypothetical protein
MPAKVMLIWGAVACIIMAVCVVLFAATVEAEDEVHLPEVPMYVNYPDPTGGTDDNLRVDPDGVWAGFGEDVEGATIVWAFADYQRKMVGLRVDITTESGVFPVCTILGVNNVDYFRTLNHPKLKVFQTFQDVCSGAEEWIKEELKY